LVNNDPGSLNQGATLGIFVCEGVVTPLSGGTVTASFGSFFTTSKAIEVYRVQPGPGDAIKFVAADATGVTGTGTTHGANTVSVNSGETIFGAAAIETNATPTGDSDTTNGSWSSAITRVASTGTAATSMLCTSQFKTVNATGNQDWACTSVASLDSARSYLIIKAAQSAPPFQSSPYLPLLVR
jgi:hypothetical protein